MPFARARAAISLAGKSWPVVQVTWLMKISRVRGVTRRGDAVDVARRARDVRLEEPDDDAVALHPVEERRVDGDVLVGRGDDLVALLERQAVDDDVDASVAPPMRPRSSLRQVWPRARASFSLTSCHCFSSWPALGARSSARVNPTRASRTGSGHEPRPPKFRKVQSGSRMNWSRMSFQKNSSSPAAAAWARRLATGRGRARRPASAASPDARRANGKSGRSRRPVRRSSSGILFSS